MVTKYELPEEADFNLLSNLREEVEMKTFKTKRSPDVRVWQRPSAEDKNSLPRGLYRGSGKKRGVYQRLSASHTTGTDQSISSTRLRVLLKNNKMEKRGRSRSSYHHNTILGAGEQELFTCMTNLYYRDSHGALVFWGPDNSSSLDAAPKWLKDVNRAYP